MPLHILGPRMEYKGCIHFRPSTQTAPILLWGGGMGRKDKTQHLPGIHGIVTETFRHL